MKTPAEGQLRVLIVGTVGGLPFEDTHGQPRKIILSARNELYVGTHGELGGDILTEHPRIALPEQLGITL